MPKISCIIPVYNVEKFLDECICSILKQSFSDFELILVDDGSKDKSGEICKKYSTLDSRVKVISQSNRGASAARNNGIKNSTGDYICFVDSDDWVYQDFFEIMYTTAVNSNADIVVCGYRQEVPIKNNSIEIRDIYSVPQEKDKVFYTREEFFHIFPKLRTDNNMLLALQSPCMRLIKRRSDLPLFDENTAYGEDDLFNIRLYEIINSICYIKPLLYFYRYNSSSITKKMPINRITDGLWIINENMRLFQKFCSPKDIKYFWKYKKITLFRLSLGIINSFSIIGKKDAKEMFQLIRKEISMKIIFSNMARYKESLFLLFVKIGFEQGNGPFSIYLKSKK